MFLVLWFITSALSLYITWYKNIDFEDDVSDVLWFLLALIGGPIVGIVLLLDE